MAENSVEVTDASAFQEASLGKQVLFSIVTFGLYSLYWTYNTADQLDRGTNADVSPILVFVPFLGMWKLSNAGKAVTDQDGPILFVMFLFTGVLGWYLVQTGINEVASS
jgi:hypothetical protein